MDNHFRLIILAMVAAQVVSCYFMKDMSWPVVILFAYVVGGTINHSLTLAIHELSHHPVFGYSHPVLNQYFGILINLPVGIPMSISFKKYHLDHHRYLGDETMDVDVPLQIEGVMFRNSFLKLIWVFLNPFFYALRPFGINPKQLTEMEAYNIIIQVLFNTWIFHIWGCKALVYLIGGSLLAMGIHPLAGHFISEHYMYTEGHETYSYYGSLNRLTFNVGYHMEHHDFPNIPGAKLPLVSKNIPCSKLQNALSVPFNNVSTVCYVPKRFDWSYIFKERHCRPTKICPPQ